MFYSKGKACSSLLIATYNGYQEIVELLIANGASISVVDGSEETLLHKACAQGHRDIAEFLIVHGAQVNANSKHGDTPLYLATVGRHQDIVQLLLDCGATIDLDIAVILGDVELVRQHLPQGTDIKGQKITKGSHKDNTWLNISILYQHKDLFEFLLNNGALVNQKAGTFQMSPLHQAAIANSLDMVEILITRGADINATDKHGKTPLHLAGQRGYEKMVKRLVELGANVNILDVGNRTVLFYAAKRHDLEIVRYLLSSGAEVNLTDTQGVTPLLCAFQEIKDDEIVKIIVAHGAHVNIQSHIVSAPLHRAVAHENKNLVDILIGLWTRGKGDLRKYYAN